MQIAAYLEEHEQLLGVPGKNAPQVSVHVESQGHLEMKWSEGTRGSGTHHVGK